MINRVAIDAECHEEYHRQGASDTLIAIWRLKTELYLKSIGAWEEYEQYEQLQQLN
jgi:hypothetical protein